MKKKSDLFLRISLIIGDAIAIILSFAVAYIIRIHVDPRPYAFEAQLLDFVLAVVLVVPVMIIILAALGLYRKSVIFGRSKSIEWGRLLLAAVLSVAALIVYDFFKGENVFPVRVMAVTAMVLCFVFLVAERIVVRLIIRQVFRKDFATRRVLIVGNSKNTEYLADYIASNPESGYKLAGVVANRRYIPDDLKEHQYSSLKEALRKMRADVIFQTGSESAFAILFRTERDGFVVTLW